MARAEAMQDRPERAARLLGASAAQREALGTFVPPIGRTDHDYATNAARATLGDRAFDAAWVAGHAMSLEEVISEVVGEEE